MLCLLEKLKERQSKSEMQAEKDPGAQGTEVSIPPLSSQKGARLFLGARRF